MAGDVFIVLIIFSGLVMIVKAAIDGIVRAKALKSDAAAAEVIKALSQTGTPFHLVALKWGLGLGLQPDQPSTWGVVALSIAAGLLSFYGLARKNIL